MAAKRKTLWQILATQLLLVAVPLYGLAPELSALASSHSDWEPKTRLRVSSSAREDQPQAIERFHPEIASGDSFHAEAIGTVRALSNEAGEVTDRYALEAFGTLLDHQGDDPNAYLFAGEPLDPNSGFYYNRARWLEPSRGAFASLDPAVGLLEEQLGAGGYLYSRNQPADMTDPSGLFGLHAPFGVAALMVGLYVHQKLGRDFVQQGPGRFANYFPIWRILGLAGADQCVMSPWTCRIRPDLTDTLADPLPEVYEIKPAGPAQPLAAFIEVSLYIASLQANDPQRRVWELGASFVPEKGFFAPVFGGYWIQTARPVPGVILYTATSRAMTAATIAGIVTLAVNATAGSIKAFTAQAGLTSSVSRGFI